MSTREFVWRLKDTLGLPTVVLADGDPGGIQIALTYAHGSLSTALETPWLACRGLSWAGIWPSEIDGRFFRESDLIRLGEPFLGMAHTLLAHPSHAYVNDRVRAELASLLERGAYVALDMLAVRDMARSVDYLRHKLFESELIKL
jgi:DNA topoisomerase VI subunit A